MKKITRKSNRRRLLLFVVPIAILAVGITTGTAFLFSKQKQPVYNSERVATKQTTDTTEEQPTKEIADTTIATPEPVKQPDTATQQPSAPATPEKSVYEKYGVDQSIAQ